MTPSTTNTAALEAVEDHANRMCDVLAAYDQAVSDLSGAYECGWNADDCRPRLHRHVDRLRRLVLHHMQALRTKQQGGEQEVGVAVIVGELTSFVAHIATCHSNLDGTTTLPASVKASAINITERCNMTELVYTALRTKQQGGEQEVGALVGKWRRLASYEDEEGELEVGSESAVRLIRCADELEAALRTKQPAASEGDVVRSAQHVKNIATMPNEIRSAILEALAAYDPERMARCGNTSKQAAGEAVDSTFAEWLASEMPAGTVIGDPTWWANRIARQYQVHCTPRHPADEGRDAERYRFIRGCEENQGPLSVGEVIGVNEHGGEYVAWLYDEELDAAIDAALQAGPP